MDYNSHSLLPQAVLAGIAEGQCFSRTHGWQDHPQMLSAKNLWKEKLELLILSNFKKKERKLHLAVR